MSRRLTAVAVSTVAAVAGYASYTHIETLAATHGATPVIAHMMPVSVDGLIVASSAALLSRGPHAVARMGLALGIVATLYANVETGLRSGTAGALVALWPAVAFIVASEILLGMVRTAPDAEHGTVPEVNFADDQRLIVDVSGSEHAAVPVPVLTSAPGSAPTRPPRKRSQTAPRRPRQAAPEVLYASELASGTVPSQRRIRADLHVGQSKAKAIHDELTAVLVDRAVRPVPVAV